MGMQDDVLLEVRNQLSSSTVALKTNLLTGTSLVLDKDTVKVTTSPGATASGKAVISISRVGVMGAGGASKIAKHEALSWAASRARSSEEDVTSGAWSATG